MTTSDVPMLDLDRFESIEDAITQAEASRQYDDEFSAAVDGVSTLTFLSLFYSSVVSRLNGVHGAIVREIRESNPHAVFPLLRTLAETVLVLAYTVDHPDYVQAVMVDPEDKPPVARKSPQALIAAIAEDAPGFKNVYGELSDTIHFGAFSMWGPHTIEPDDEPESLGRLVWRSAPHWKREEDPLIACAQTIELAEAACIYLHNFAGSHIRPYAAPPSE